MPEDYGNEGHKVRAAAWFSELRDNLCAALEAAEQDVQGPNLSSEGDPGLFERKTWQRSATEDGTDAGGGGVMSILRGRVFEKAGVNWVTRKKHTAQNVIIFEPQNIDSGKKSIAFNVTLEPKDKTLNEKDIDEISKKIILTVQEKTGATLRS